MKKIRNIALPVLFLFVSVLGMQHHSIAQTNKWVGTWSCAPYAAAQHTPPSPFLENNTLRQIVRASIGGDTIRVKFSNITSSTPVTLQAVNIAVSTEVGGSTIDTSTLKQLFFKGNASVTMAPYSNVVSDPLAFDLEPGTHLAITIYYGECRTAADMTFHYGSRTDSYLMAGDHAEDEVMTGATRVERWYTINTIDVIAPESSASVAVIGNSITDGYGLHGGLKNKWTDWFSKKLLAYEPTADVGVLNLGIGATWLTSSGVSRFQQDILEQEGLRWIIVFYGVNDIGGGASAEAVIGALQKMIYQAHANNVRIYGGTITPFKGHGYYSTGREAIRQEVNEWIRTPGNFDKCIDFDAAIRDEEDPEKMQAIYSNDWLHPNATGYQYLGEIIDPDLFVGADTIYSMPEYTSQFYEVECGIVGTDWNVVEEEQASNNHYVMVKDGLESTAEAKNEEAALISLPVVVDSVGDYTIYARVNCPSPNDDSFWLKINDGEFEMKNGLATSGWQWHSLGTYSLDKGENLLTIGYREDGAKMDKIALSNSPYGPEGVGEEAVNACEISLGEQNSILLQQEIEFKAYPNPFNESVQFSYKLNSPGDVKLNLFNQIGQKVMSYSDDNQQPGQYVLTWNATSDSGQPLPFGTYLYQLSIGNDNLNGRVRYVN